MIGTGQIIVIAIVTLVLFGRGRISGIMKEVGSGIRSFRKGLDNQTLDDEVKLQDAQDSGNHKSESI